MDVKSINIPNLSFIPTKEIPSNNSNIYIYAAFAKPGHHQILIYDPLINRAFCKDFMINLNLREDIFPEFPVLEGFNMRKGIKNMFESWKDET